MNVLRNAINHLVEIWGCFKSTGPPCSPCTDWNQQHICISLKRKKSAWSLWQPMPELTLSLLQLCASFPKHEAVNNNAFSFQLSVVKLYKLADYIASIDAARRYLFFHRGQDFTHLLTSSDAVISISFELHIRYFKDFAYQFEMNEKYL